MRQEAVDVVERVTGRTVIGFMSDIDPEANLASEVFLLDSLPENGTVGVANAGGDVLESETTRSSILRRITPASRCRRSPHAAAVSSLSSARRRRRETCICE
jgi:hypothetical protein